MIFAKKIQKKMYTVFDDYMENDPNCGLINRQKKTTKDDVSSICMKQMEKLYP